VLLHDFVACAPLRRARRRETEAFHIPHLICVTDPGSGVQMEGGSAARTGQVAVGDIIHSIGGVDGRDLSVDDIISLIKGPQGNIPPDLLAPSCIAG